ncbi:hypothetical protein WN55_04206 [Dufourea novaeangliae]|nr:hypothetical protein WN55_04206 [Dufourea novaeangliae]
MVQPEDGTSLTAESQFEELDIKQSFDVSHMHPGSSMTVESQFEEMDIKQSFDECGVHDCVCKMARDYYVKKYRRM